MRLVLTGVGSALPDYGHLRDCLGALRCPLPVHVVAVDDCAAEHERLVARGVVFTQPPVAMGPVTTAVFDDTCGNLVQIASRNG